MDAPITVAHMRVKSGRGENGKPVLTHLHKCVMRGCTAKADLITTCHADLS